MWFHSAPIANYAAKHPSTAMNEPPTKEVPMRERQTTRYATALDELDGYAEFHRFQGAGAFFAWERLKGLVAQLRANYDRFELEGDIDPVRAAIDTYQRDLWAHHIKPDQGINARLYELVSGLEAEASVPVIDVLVATVPAAPGARWPEHLLAVRPEDLRALLAERSSPPPVA
jgi:hypothetical protein